MEGKSGKQYTHRQKSPVWMKAELQMMFLQEYQDYQQCYGAGGDAWGTDSYTTLRGTGSAQPQPWTPSIWDGKTINFRDSCYSFGILSCGFSNKLIKDFFSYLCFYVQDCVWHQ